MEYDNMHNITRKNQYIKQYGIQFCDSLMARYNLGYTIAGNCQQISNIADESYRAQGTDARTPVNKVEQFSYDANGNLLCINTGTKSGDKL